MGGDCFGRNQLTITIMVSTAQQARDFEGFVTTPRGLEKLDMDARIQALESKFLNILSIEEKLDRVLAENDSFKKEIYLLMIANKELLKEKVEMEKENQQLRKQCEEMKAKLLEMEMKISEGDLRKEECLNLIDTRMKEVNHEHLEVQRSFREIVKKQEEENKGITQREMVKALKENEYVVRDIAEKKKCVIIIGLREETNRNWQDRRDKENDRIKSLLNKISVEEEDLYAEVEESVRLGAFEEGKNRPLKLKLKSQVAAEALLRRAWKLKDSEETKTIYIRRNMSQDERMKMKELVTEVKERNDERTEEEKTKFFWRMRNGRLKKWWIKQTE